jgi:teichuronic acid biosynthesis glycosyltransferase TuaC
MEPQKDNTSPSILYVTTGRINPNGALYYPPLVANQINSLKPFIKTFYTIVIHSLQPIFLLKRILEVKQLSSRYDIIHAQYGSLTALVAYLGKGKKPLVISFGGSDLLGSAGKGIQWTFRNWLTRKLGLIAAEWCSKIIVKSVSLFLTLPEKLRKKAIIIPNGVDINVFYPQPKSEMREKLGWKEADYYILFTPSRANNVLVKNLTLANSVIDHLKMKMDNTCLEFILDKSPQQVAEMMNAADCLLLTSLHEGSPNVIKEAMACNLPIVSVNVGDVSERLKDVTNSFVVEGYDRDTISQKLEVILNSNARTNGFEQLKKQELTAEGIAKRIVAVYNEVLR